MTGASGFVGHHTMEHLIKNTDWEIISLDSFRHKGLSARLREVFEANPGSESRVTVVSHDITTPIDILTADKIGHVDIIINMASESHVDRSIIYPRHFIENNVALVTNMLEYARKLPDLKLFIQISTDEVYGPARDGVAHPEYDAIVPSNPYSASKAAQEAIAISYWRTYDVPVIISNTMNIIGERQDAEKFVPKTINSILSGKKVSVHANYKDGKWISGSRFYLHARNQADALMFVINSFGKYPIKFSEGLSRPHRFHVGGEREVYNDEMVGLIAKYLGAEGEWVDYQDVGKTRPGHDLRYALDRGTLEEWGWQPAVSFEQSLEKTVHWYVKNKIWLTV